MRMKILFVDDTPRVLKAIQHKLLIMRREWHIRVIENGQEALALLSREPCDVVIADTRMPVMNGSALLRQVKRDHPEMVRIAMAQPGGRDGILKRHRSAHQFVPKPCDMETLKMAVSRACQIERLLRTVDLRKMTSSIESLPDAESPYRDLIEGIRDRTLEAVQVAERLASDPGMCEKAFLLAKLSAGPQAPLDMEAADAVEILGLDVVMALAIFCHTVSLLDTVEMDGFSSEDFWNHSFTVAFFAKWITESEIVIPEGESDSEEVALARQVINDAFIGGLLHDLGKPLMAAFNPKGYARALELSASEEMPMEQAELKCMQASHAEAGAHLLRYWNLDDSLIDVLFFHHDPSESRASRFNPPTAVHVANVLVNGFLQGMTGLGSTKIDEVYLEHLDLLLNLDFWRETCEDSFREKMGYA
ncbi:MAG TPA: HDOD domain-containing protein [Candidatus Sumerlaeota bacterium]|nr:HDOD domain-containing protein [Candidatus Sumerlaeota bacterium]HPS00540.1 HDOD domain-containing protein [Candidatus Sumerlaeota bacterium]